MDEYDRSNVQRVTSVTCHRKRVGHALTLRNGSNRCLTSHLGNQTYKEKTSDHRAEEWSQGTEVFVEFKLLVNISTLTLQDKELMTPVQEGVSFHNEQIFYREIL